VNPQYRDRRDLDASSARDDRPLLVHREPDDEFDQERRCGLRITRCLRARGHGRRDEEAQHGQTEGGGRALEHISSPAPTHRTRIGRQLQLRRSPLRHPWRFDSEPLRYAEED